MTEKKPYSPPQIFQVELNQEQAILAVCSSAATRAKYTVRFPRRLQARDPAGRVREWSRCPAAPSKRTIHRRRAAAHCD